MQVTVNLTEHKIEKYLGEDLIEVREYGSLKELNDNELSNLAFDELVVVEDAQIEEYAQENDLLYINMLDYQEEIGIDWQTDTYDTGLHLNVYGAEKASKWFGNVLATQCGVADRRNGKQGA